MAVTAPASRRMNEAKMLKLVCVKNVPCGATRGDDFDEIKPLCSA